MRFGFGLALCGVISLASLASGVFAENGFVVSRAGVGDEITLDPSGGLSVAPDQQLIPTWSWVSRPSTSVANFSDAGILRPQVLIDVPGEYIAELTLQAAGSDPASEPLSLTKVTFGTGNLPPVAVINGRGLPNSSRPLVLDGSASYDIDGDAVTYQWDISQKPNGSALDFTQISAPLVEFIPDVAGSYTVSLTVADHQGNTSGAADYSVSYYPGDTVLDQYRPAYDRVISIDHTDPEHHINLGDLQSSDEHILINGFRLHRLSQVINQTPADSITFVYRGVEHRLSSGASFLAFVSYLEHDLHLESNARISPNKNIRDLTFEFDGGHGSITFRNLMEPDCDRLTVLLNGADFYQGFQRDKSAPEARFNFDQLVTGVGEAVEIDPFASVDLDGAVLSSELAVVVRPAGSDLQASEQNGRLSVTPDLAGDYLVALSVSDGVRRDNASMILASGRDENVRPVARIAPVNVAGVGAEIALDGAQSYDFNGDLLTYRWALLHRPIASNAALSQVDGPFSGFTPDVAGEYVVQLIAGDGQGASVPVTQLIVVSETLPIADAGADILTDTTGQANLDAGMSITGANAVARWSVTGLIGEAPYPVPDGADQFATLLSLSRQRTPLADVLADTPVYHQWGRQGAQCHYDTRPASDLGGAHSVITLWPLGKFYDASGRVRFVWAVKNIGHGTANVALKDSSGVSHGSYDVPGKTSLLFSLDSIGWHVLKARVNGHTVGSGWQSYLPFYRDAQVCTRPSDAVAQVVVADDHGISRPDTVYVGTGNIRPVFSRTARVGVTGPQDIRLNANDYSFDANGDALSYGWSLLHRPVNSAAALGSPVVAGAELTFTPDRSGLYLLQATATDQEMTAHPVVVVVEVLNAPPTAVVAGIGSVFVGETAVLDGSGSSDPEQDALSYAWHVTGRPAGSTASIRDSSAAITEFSPDKRGVYTFSLVVSDYEHSSAPAIATLTVPNRAPIAVLEGPLEVEPDTQTVYTASGSSDPDRDDLTFTYAVISQPSGAAPAFVDLGNGEAGFTTSTAGSYTLEVAVSDGLLTTSQTLDIEVKAGNAPPVLAPLDTSYTVEAGLEFALDLSATDADGDVLSFFARPLPLVRGMALEAHTGAIRFRPEADQLGSYSFTVGVSDGTLKDEAVVNVEVVAANHGDTAVYGRVLDAVDFANGTITPLSGMPVRLKGAALMTTTQADGTFSFGSLGAGRDLITVEPSAAGGPGGYLAARRVIAITDNQNRDLSPDFLLVPLDDGCAPVTAGQATVVSSAVSGVRVEIPADSVETATGAAYSGQVCLGSLPDLFDHPGFNESTTACRIYALDAPGAVFTQPISITGPNLDNLPETTQLALWRVSRTNGNFRPTTPAFVDSGGATVSAVAQKVAPSTLFTFLPQAPKTRASADQPEGVNTLTPFDGDNSATYVLPGYTAFGQPQQIALSYHSKSADPVIIVAGDVEIGARASLPVTLSTRLQLGGLSISDTNQWTPRRGVDGATPALVGEALTLRQSMPLDGTGLASGRYDARFTAQARYDCSTVSASHNAQVYVRNETESPYGAGWSVDGLQKLVVNPDGSVAILDDDTLVPFDPANDFTAFDDNPVVIEGIGVADISVGDFDGNGTPDLMFPTSGDGALNVAFNNGNRDISLSTSTKVSDPVNVPTTGGYAPNLLAAAGVDYSGDGILDIIHSSQGSSTMGIAEGDGFGNFTNSDLAKLRPAGFAVLDFDGDGLTDIVLPGRGGFFGVDIVVTVFYGNPAGGFTRQAVADLGYMGMVGDMQIEVVDIDADGHLDVAVRSQEGVNFAFGEGGRRFVVRGYSLGEGGQPIFGDRMKLADMDGDGDLDLIWSAFNRMDYFRNNGGRAFDASVPIQRPVVEGRSASVAVLDVTQDGANDLLVSGDGKLFVLPGRGDGTFEPAVENIFGHDIEQLWVEDIDGDGGLDLVSTQRFSVTVDFSKPSDTGRFVSGKGDFSTLTELPGGGWERRYKDGSITRFDETGRQTAEIDTYGQITAYAYDTLGRLISKTDQVGGQTLFAYGPGGLLESITYPDGRVTTFDYNSQAQLTGVEEPTGPQISFKYDENNRLVSTINQNGNSTIYAYNDVGNMSGATLPDGSNVNNQVASSLGLVDGLGGLAAQPLVFIRPENRVTTVTDRKGQQTEITVNEFGSIVQTKDPLGRITRMERNDQNLITRIERPSNGAPGGVRTDSITYDKNANVLSVREAIGSSAERSISYTYEPLFNKVITQTDGAGFTTTYEYDAQGGLLREIDALGASEAKTYTPEGKLASRTDKNGNTTGFTYNARQNLETITYADGSLTRLSYDPRGNTTTIAEAAGTPIERQVQRQYDGLNRVLSVEITGPDGTQIDGITTYTYLPAGNLATVTDETGLTTSMSYDALERLVALNDPAEGQIRRSYNNAGEMSAYTNGDDETWTYAYDTVSRLTQTTDPEGFTKSFAYDARDNVLSVTDGGGGTTTFGYDARDRMLTRTNPLGQSMARAYDARDNLTRLTREDGTEETATYDGLSRRTQVQTPDNTLRYAYDSNGNLTEATDDDSAVTFTYDTRNRLESTTTDGSVGPQPQVTLSYTYDALDRRLSMSDSLGGTTQYAYDVEDRLTGLTAPWGTVYGFGYDGEGRRTSLTSSSGRASSYAYENGLLSALTHVQSGVTLTNLAYEYGPDGQLAAILDRVDPSKSKTISYDNLNRLVQVAEGVPGEAPLPIEDYAYDEEGNRTASHLSAIYSSNDHNQLLEDADYSYGYDVKGNRISRTSKATGEVETYTYDSQNRLIGYTNGTTTASYAYDAMERRIAKTVDGSGESYIHDGAWLSDVVLDFTDGTLTNRWLQGPRTDEPLAYESYGADNAPGAGVIRELLHNRLGSVLLAITVSTGAVAGEYQYDSFGHRAATGIEQRYGFTGREHDAESGLIYLRARHYDATTGRFLQRDPIGFAGGDLNLYAYTWNDPHNWTDPSGLVASFEYRVISVGVAAGGLRALDALVKWCLRTPTCRNTGVETLGSGARDMAEAMGIGLPSGSTAPGGVGSRAASGGIFGAIANATLGLLENINTVLSKIEPGKNNGKDGNGGDGDKRGKGAGGNGKDNRPSGGGKNDQKQPKGVEKLKRDLEKAYDHKKKLVIMPNKTKDIAKQIKKAKGQIDHLIRKIRASENHSMKHKR